MERGLEKESKRRDTRELHMVLVVLLVVGEREGENDFRGFYVGGGCVERERRGK